VVRALAPATTSTALALALLIFQLAVAVTLAAAQGTALRVRRGTYRGLVTLLVQQTVVRAANPGRQSLAIASKANEETFFDGLLIFF